jgi:hypothetical protein
VHSALAWLRRQMESHHRTDGTQGRTGSGSCARAATRDMRPRLQASRTLVGSELGRASRYPLRHQSGHESHVVRQAIQLRDQDAALGCFGRRRGRPRVAVGERARPRLCRFPLRILGDDREPLGFGEADDCATLGLRSRDRSAAVALWRHCSRQQRGPYKLHTTVCPVDYRYIRAMMWLFSLLHSDIVAARSPCSSQRRHLCDLACVRSWPRTQRKTRQRNRAACCNVKNLPRPRIAIRR